MSNTVVFLNRFLYVNGECVNGVGDVECFKKLFPNPKGKVLMGGLGLGRDVQYLLSCPDVTNLTVYEIIPEVIERYSPKDERLTIIQGDFFAADQTGYDLVIDTIEKIEEVK